MRAGSTVFYCMRFFLLGLSLSILLTVPALAQKLVKETVDPTVSIEVPEGFKRLQGEAAQARSLSFRSPLGVYVDPAGDADLVVNEAHSFFDPKDIEIMRDFYQANIRNFYTKVVFIRKDIITVSGKKGIVFEFTAEVSDKSSPRPIKKYILAHYGLRKRRVIVATFSCEEKNRAKWAKTAEAALATMKITEK